MKIIIKHGLDSECTPWEELIVDGKKRQYVAALCECPEDAIIGRDLVSCMDIAEFMKEAYEAGERGDGFSIERQPEEQP